MTRPTFQECSDIQRHLRKLALTTGDISSGLKSAPFIFHLLEVERLKRHPYGSVPLSKKEPPVAPRPIVTEHHVKKFVFSDGTIWESCTATGCEFATSTGGDRVQVKKHTDGAIGIYDDPDFEQSAEDPAELSLEAKPIVAGEDQPEAEEYDEFLMPIEEEPQPVACGVEGDE